MKEFQKAYISAVKMLLAEENEEKKQKQKKKPEMLNIHKAQGGGGVSKATILGREIAINRPKALMKNLQISEEAKGKTDIDKAIDLLTHVINNNEAMSEAYDLPRKIMMKISQEDKEKTECVQVPIISDDLRYRDATAFIHLALLGAYNAGLLKLQQPIQFLNSKTITGCPVFTSGQ